MQLPPSTVWFVRSNGGSGSYPVTREGWRTVWVFVAGMAASAILGLVLAGIAANWLWIAVAAAGMAISAFWFIRQARAHTDYSITHAEYVKANKDNA